MRRIGTVVLIVLVAALLWTWLDWRRANRAPAIAALDWKSVNDPLPRGAVPRLGTTRFRVPSYMMQFVLSPDNRSVVAADWHGMLHVIDVESGLRKKFVSVTVEERIAQLAFNPDGSRLAAIVDGRFHEWEFPTGTKTASIKPSGDGLLIRLKYFDDNRILAALLDKDDTEDCNCLFSRRGNEMAVAGEWEIPQLG